MLLRGQRAPKLARPSVLANCSPAPQMPKERLELLDRSWSDAAELYLK